MSIMRTMGIICSTVFCLTAFCLLLAPASFAGSLKPAVINDIRTVEHNSGTLGLAGKKMEYSISYQFGGRQTQAQLVEVYTIPYMEGMMKDVWQIMDNFLESKSIPSYDCRPNYNLNFFVISPEEMLREDRFAYYFRINNLRPSLVYAFYDTTPDVYAESAIILTNLGQPQNNFSVAHELAHYWWDRLCVANHYDSGGEAFALEFEAHYKEVR